MAGRWFLPQEIQRERPGDFKLFNLPEPAFIYVAVYT